jgi:hypothetical protein
LRQEIPFERWFFNYGFQTPIEDSAKLIEAHVWAVIATVEGAIRLAAEGASLLFSQFVQSSPEEMQHHSQVLQAQWQGLTLSLLAIISPNAAKQKAHNSEDSPLVGASLLNWQWGTLYSGSFEAPFWHLECRYYRWYDQPSL